MADPIVPIKKPATTPWKPASLLVVSPKYKRPGMVQRWCHKDQLERHMAEGWIPIKGDQSAASPQVTLPDGTQLSGLIKKRDLILCEMPKEIADSRKLFYSNLAKANAEGSIGQFTNGEEVKEANSAAYGEVKVNLGPVNKT